MLIHSVMNVSVFRGFFMNVFNLNHLLSQSFDFSDMLKHTFSTEQITHTQIYTGMERFFCSYNERLSLSPKVFYILRYCNEYTVK